MPEQPAAMEPDSREPADHSDGCACKPGQTCWQNAAYGTAPSGRVCSRCGYKTEVWRGCPECGAKTVPTDDARFVVMNVPLWAYPILKRLWWRSRLVTGTFYRHHVRVRLFRRGYAR